MVGILESLSLAIVIITCVTVLGVKMMKNRLANKKSDIVTGSLTADNIEDSSIQGFNDVIIEHTKERISHELSSFTSIETKAGITIATAAAILAIILSPSSSPIYQAALIKHLETFFFFLGLGIIGFSLSFGFAIMTVVPRKKLDLLDPRKMNDDFNESDLEETKRQLRHKLIQSFEDLQKERRIQAKILLSSLISLAVGALGFTLLYLTAR